MFVVTKSARARLAEKLGAHGDEAVIRMVRKQRRWKLRLDRAEPRDIGFTHEERRVLVMAPDAAKSLENRTLDVAETADGPRLKLRRAEKN